MSVSGRYRVDVGSIRRRSRVDLLCVWGRPWVDMGSTRVRPGVDLGSALGRFEGQVGVDEGSIWPFALPREYLLTFHPAACGRITGFGWRSFQTNTAACNSMLAAGLGGSSVSVGIRIGGQKNPTIRPHVCSVAGHLERSRNMHSWVAKLFLWRGRQFLMRRRAEFHDSGALGRRTGTRIGAGHVHTRRHAGVTKVEAWLEASAPGVGRRAWRRAMCV